MNSGKIKNRIDTISGTFWTGDNTLTILEQVSCLFFIKMLAHIQHSSETNADVQSSAPKDPIFKNRLRSTWIEHSFSYRDNLSIDNNAPNKYHLCLNNPPCTSDLDHKAASKTRPAITGPQKTRMSFLPFFVRMLRTDGRRANIGPNGAFCGNNTARKPFVRNHWLSFGGNNLATVRSCRPYSNASSAILIFTTTNASGTELNFKVEALPTRSTAQKGSKNDISHIIARSHYLATKEKQTRRKQSLLAPADEIRKTGYDLSQTKNKYRASCSANLAPSPQGDFGPYQKFEKRESKCHCRIKNDFTIFHSQLFLMNFANANNGKTFSTVYYIV